MSEKDLENYEEGAGDSEEPEEVVPDAYEGCASNEDLQKFLQKWDRDLDPSRRVYGIKVLFAGVESEKYREGVHRIGIRHILVSYFYMRPFFKRASVQQVGDAFGKFDYVFLDSGGFTFIQARNKGKKLNIDPKEYADEYYANLKRFGHLFAGCAEVDLRQELGYSYMEEKQKEMLDHGITLLPIIQGDEIAKYEGMGWFDCHHYIGVGSKLLGDQWAGYRQQLYEIGKKKGIIYHGLAATSVKFIQRSQFYSVDSSVGGSSIVWVREKGLIRRVAIADLFEESEIVSREGIETRANPVIGTETLSIEKAPLGGFERVWKPLKSIVRHDITKDRVRIRLQAGLGIEVTTDHSLFKINSSGELVETKPSDLVVGDWIIATRGPLWSGEGLDKIKVEVKFPVVIGSARQWHDDVFGEHEFILDREFLELVGFWIGDGSYTGETSVSFSCGIDLGLVERIERWAKSLGRSATVSKKNDVQVSHHTVVRALREIGLVGKARTKRLPDWFWNLSESQACDVLRGLFTADGSGGDKPYLATTSEELARQVQDAVAALTGHLPSFGVAQTGYRVTLSSTDAKKVFASKIGFLVERKKIDSSREARWSRIEELPAELSFRGVYQCAKGAKPNRCCRDREGFAKSVKSPDLLYLSIIEIEELDLEQIDVYDLEVPGPERFIANNILAHNTTWLGGAQFGNTLIFKNGRIKYYDMTGKEVRKRYKQRFEENGLIWKDIEADKHFEVNLMNGLAWKQYSEYIRYNGMKSYWLSPEERVLALELKSKAFNAEGLMDRKASIQRAEFRRISQIRDPSYDGRAHEVLYCNQCNMAGRCPRYSAGQGCGYDINVRLETKADIQKGMQLMLEVQHGRVMTGVLFEKLEGGVIDKHLSVEIKQYMEMAQDLRGLYDPVPEEELTLRAKGKKGSLANMLASVFQKTGTGKSGSGNTYTERAANRVLSEDSEIEAYDIEGVIDMEAVPIEK